MKKILFFIPTLSGGGAEKVLVNLVNNMDKNKFSITVMTLFNVGVNIESLKEDIEYKYIFNKMFRGNKHILKLFKPEILFKLMIKDEYDIIVSYLQGPTTRIVSGCKSKNIKIVNWIHNEIHDIKMISSSYRSVKETINCYKKYDATVFVSETVRNSFSMTMPSIKSNLKVIYNTIDTDKIKIKSLEEIDDVKYNSDKVNLISVGRFAHQKGYERLLNIMAKLINEDKIEVQLYLLGKGELEGKYKEIVFRNNIQNNITFLGYKDNPYKYVRNSDLFVCSSYYEGYSTAVTESLIVGTPVLTTLCSGMKELLGKNNEYGIIVDNSDESLYLALKDLLLNKWKINDIRDKAFERGRAFDKANTVSDVEKFFYRL